MFQNGRLVEWGSDGELLKRKGLYHELTSAQMMDTHLADTDDTISDRRKIDNVSEGTTSHSTAWPIAISTIDGLCIAFYKKVFTFSLLSKLLPSAASTGREHMAHSGLVFSTS